MDNNYWTVGGFHLRIPSHLSSVSTSSLQSFDPIDIPPLPPNSTSAPCQLHSIDMTAWRIQYRSKDSCRIWLQNCLSAMNRLQTVTKALFQSCNGPAKVSSQDMKTNVCLSALSVWSSQCGEEPSLARWSTFNDGLNNCLWQSKFRGGELTFTSQLLQFNTLNNEEVPTIMIILDTSAPPNLFLAPTFSKSVRGTVGIYIAGVVNWHLVHLYFMQFAFNSRFFY